MMKTSRKYIALMALVSTVFILLISNILAQESKKKQITLGFYSSIVEEQNANELVESFKIWGEAIQKHSQDESFSKATINYNIYLTQKEFYDAIKSRQVEFVNLSSLDFYNMKLQNIVTPLLAPNKMASSKYIRYLLISHSSSTVNTVSDIKSGEIIVPNSYSLNLMKTWINVELKEKQTKPFKGKISITAKKQTENEALYGVFFKKNEYCVVNHSTFMIACELNPQLKKSLKLIATSPDLINNFLANIKGTDPAIVEILVQEGIQLQKHVWGKQLLDLMQAESMHKISLQDMFETEKMIIKYNSFYK
ncbi:MAG: PhnD/SsuA/transferrin family substrate-binding protein [Melioribacteraceae bacterium]|nr:PhnD/SsuA/transferrin family substrate-binding protein [Melioribacteraceae bacterium]